VRSAITTHWTEARVSLDVIEKLPISALCARPVNSGVGRLHGFNIGDS
jgi:hypothetical protein